MADIQTEQPKRLSRYRSQRRAQQQAQGEEVPEVPEIPPQEDAPVDDGLVRSRSRYHRKNATESRPETARPVTARDQGQFDAGRSTAEGQSPPQESRGPVNSANRYHERHTSPPAQLGAPDLRRMQSKENTSPGVDLGHGQDLNRHLVDRATGATSQPSPQRAHASPLRSQPTGQLFPSPKAEPVMPAAQALRADGPPISSHIRATKSISEMPVNAESDEEDGGCFGLFKRKRGEASPQAERRPSARLSDTNDTQRAMRVGGSVIAPGTDAPISAVNAGDRKVLVECGNSKTVFPVTPTTTPVDIIKSAANCMSERINVKSAVLLEHFGTVGVQRPLRRYEHVRDVMNSWDTDRQNSLLLVDPGTGSSEPELSITGAPQERPAEASWLLSYSQKVGKWDKRVITINSEGRITQQKDPNKPQQQENVCHLSDFDIYTPTQDKLRRKIKPPKKFCYAIKSQQKTGMFESTQNYVHFFCTNDRRTADDFYSAVQGWRSWYLVNVMGEGKKPKPAMEPTAADKDMGGTSKGHKVVESFDSHYQIGSFKPLIDTDQFEKRPATSRSTNAPPPSAGEFAKSASQFDTTVSPERRTSTARRKQQPPPVLSYKPLLAEDEPLGNLGKRASLDQKRTSLDQTKASHDDFAERGLLGRSYSQRQREHSDHEKQREHPFTTGPNLLNGGHEGAQEEYARPLTQDGPRRNKSTRVQHAHKTISSSELRRNQSTRKRDSVELGRSGSTRVKEMPRPLVDLTPQYREPPQHGKQGKGKGHHPDQIGPGGLIDNATSPDDPLGIPPSIDWRGRNNSPGTQPQHDSLNHARSVSRPKTARAPASADGAFTGEGLLAGGQAQQGRGGGDKGRGVMDGSRARGPLIDVNEPSKFVPGSLLNLVERERGRDRPGIGRVKSA
ncbi:hypothetical protein LTR85_011577 [Meristemomyces frigidus]|nr:hypothetical protein LTR85_011577 [Meristemomyces frigidus]